MFYFERLGSDFDTSVLNQTTKSKLEDLCPIFDTIVSKLYNSVQNCILDCKVGSEEKKGTCVEYSLRCSSNKLSQQLLSMEKNFKRGSQWVFMKSLEIIPDFCVKLAGHIENWVRQCSLTYSYFSALMML